MTKSESFIMWVCVKLLWWRRGQKGTERNMGVTDDILSLVSALTLLLSLVFLCMLAAILGFGIYVLRNVSMILLPPNIDPMFVHVFIHKKGTLDLYHCLFQSALISWWVLTWIDYRNPFICYFVFFYETACAIWLRIILTLQERPFIWFQGWFPVIAQISQILETGNR